MKVPSVQTPRLHEQVVQQLVQRIVGGEFSPGESLPTEPDLAQRFGVSRTVVREAVRVLASKGLVSVRQGSGMWVQPADRWDHLDPLLIFERVRGGGDNALLDELIETRRVLETEIAALAAERRTAEDLRVLEAALDGMERSKEDAEEYTRQDIVFHDAILAAARNRLLREALRPVASALREGRFIAVRRAGVISRSLPSHRAIHAAIEEQNADQAREAMRKHITQFEEDIRAGLRPGG
jgi:DNA-binding FadR family transcriptional regulator